MKSVSKKDRNTLFSRLLFTILPIALIPLAIASILGFYHAEKWIVSHETIELQKSTNLVGEITQQSIDKALTLSQLITESPTKIDLLKATSDLVIREKLAEQPIDRVEARYRQTKRLQANPALDRHLRSTAKDNGFTEILLTEKHGFNVAFSHSPDAIGQKDTKWWREAKTNGWSLGSPELDRATNTWAVPIARAIKDPNTGEFLGAIVASFHLPQLAARIENYVSLGAHHPHSTHIIAPESGSTIVNISSPKSVQQLSQLPKDNEIAKIGRLLQKTQLTPDRLKQEIAAMPDVEIKDFQVDRQGKVQVTIEYRNRVWSLTPIPGTPWVAISSNDIAEVLAPAIELLCIFSLMALFLGAAAVWASLLLARHLSRPIHELTNTAREMSEGNLNLYANIDNGTTEVRILARAFNELVDRSNSLLTEQKQQSEALEAGIWQLVEDVEGLIDGDLTVRASLDSMEMSTVADLFNAAIENLRDIAIEVRTSTDRVNQAIVSSEISSNELSDASITTATHIDRALLSIATISAATASIINSVGGIKQLATVTAAGVTATASDAQAAISEIATLTHSIANFTVTQSAATKEIENILAHIASTTAESDRLSAEMKASIQSTAEIAQHLAAKVDRFKV